MAVSASTKSRLVRSVLGAFSAAGRAIAPYSMARRLVRDNPELGGLTFAAAQAIANQSARIWQAGSILNRRGTNPLSRAEHTIDPTIREDGTRYRYRVLVELFEGGLRTGAALMEIDSDTALTRNQIREIARERVDTHTTPGRASLASLITATTDAVPVVTILTAGRRA